MRLHCRPVTRSSLLVFALWGLVAGVSGGCGGAPATGTQAVETPEVLQRREEGVKDAMKRGAYGDQYKQKAGP